MADWINNMMEVTGDAAEVADVRKHILKDGKKFTFDVAVPTPDDVRGTEKEEGWQLRHWGVKWGPEDVRVLVDEPGRLHIEFQTPFGHPDEFVYTLREKWPDVEIDAGYNSNAYTMY